MGELCKLLLNTPSPSPGLGMKLIDVREGLLKNLKSDEYKLTDQERMMMKAYADSLELVTHFAALHQKVVIGALENWWEDTKIEGTFEKIEGAGKEDDDERK